jgi:hypothetical protein
LLKLYGTVNEVISDFEFIMKLSPGQVIVDEFIDVPSVPMKVRHLPLEKLV